MFGGGHCDIDGPVESLEEKLGQRVDVTSSLDVVKPDDLMVVKVTVRQSP